MAQAVPSDPQPAGKRAQFAWCLYDWANSGFPTVIVTFVFAAYFSRAVAENTIQGTADWGHALAISGIAIAIISPILGSIADRTGRRKPWLGVFAAISIVAVALLWYPRPEPSYVLWALVFFVIANTAWEIANVFYNAMLPGLVSSDRIGRLSGWSWGLGYMGGLSCLALLLVLFVQAKTPLFGLDKEAAEHIRIVGPMVAVWFAVFAIPIFLWTPDEAGRKTTASAAIREGLAQLAGTLRQIRRHANIARFLLARLFYVDGMNTMFAFGGIYAAGTFGMSFAEIIQFGIALNVTAGLGAAGFAWLDDRIGSKRTVQIGILGLIAFGVPLLVVEGKLWFWLLALPLGIFMGPVQAASRSLMAHLAPTELRTEMFGLYALSGKVTSFAGPAVLAWATVAFESQRAGMATIIAFFVVGFVLIGLVAAPRR
ncbi:MAG: MFS transporter [Defluviicoccus sp.]|nr:MFS transporter [Defluviicoccus sp.]